MFPFDRAFALVLRPRATWTALAGERSSLWSLLLGYALPLAAIGAIATFLALRVVGIPFTHGVRHTSAGTAALQAVLSLATALAGVPVMAVVLTLLAPLFATRPDFRRALRVAVYSLTPAWLGGVFFAYPPLGGLQLLGVLYGVWELSLGVSTVMETPSGKAPAYAVVAVVASFLAGFGVGILCGILGATFRLA